MADDQNFAGTNTINRTALLAPRAVLRFIHIYVGRSLSGCDQPFGRVASAAQNGKSDSRGEYQPPGQDAKYQQFVRLQGFGCARRLRNHHFRNVKNIY